MSSAEKMGNPVALVKSPDSTSSRDASIRHHQQAPRSSTWHQPLPAAAADRRRRTGSQMPDMVHGDSTVIVGSGSPGPPRDAVRNATPWMRASRWAGK